MFFYNLLKYLCLNETIFINSTANSTIFQTYLVNDCFLQLILLIPVFTIFLIVNAYQYGFNKQISRHITSIQLIFYRLLTSLLIISLLIKFILKYFIFNIDYEISSVVLIKRKSINARWKGKIF
jgi:hypothetical protein